jgi:hypothetical protein
LRCHAGTRGVWVVKELPGVGFGGAFSRSDFRRLRGGAGGRAVGVTWGWTALPDKPAVAPCAHGTGGKLPRRGVGQGGCVTQLVAGQPSSCGRRGAAFVRLWRYKGGRAAHGTEGGQAAQAPDSPAMRHHTTGPGDTLGRLSGLRGPAPGSGGSDPRASRGGCPGGRHCPRGRFDRGGFTCDRYSDKCTVSGSGGQEESLGHWGEG